MGDIVGLFSKIKEMFKGEDKSKEVVNDLDKEEDLENNVELPSDK